MSERNLLIKINAGGKYCGKCPSRILNNCPFMENRTVESAMIRPLACHAAENDASEQAAQITRLESELAEVREALLGAQCCGNCGQYGTWKDFTVLERYTGCTVTRTHVGVQSGHNCKHWTARARLTPGDGKE